MRKIALLVLLLFSQTVVAGSSALEKQLEVRRAGVEWGAAVAEAEMQGFIDYIDSLEGASTSNTKSILRKYQSTVARARSAKSHQEMNQVWIDMLTIYINGGLGGEFSTAAWAESNSHKGNALGVWASMGKVKKERDSQIKSKENNYWRIKEKNDLEVFDDGVRDAEKVLSTLESRGLDTGTAEKQLDWIKGKRSTKQKYLRERNGLKLAQVDLEIVGKSIELAGEVVRIQLEYSRVQVDKSLIELGDRSLVQTKAVIKTLKFFQIDVRDLERSQGKAEGHLGKAKKAFERHDLEATEKSLLDLLEEMNTMGDIFCETIPIEKLPPQNREKIEEMCKALKQMQAGMKAKL